MALALADASLHVHTSLAAVETRWRQLWAVSPGYAFQSFDWFAAWNAALGQPQGWRVCIVEWRSHSGETLMLLPLGLRRERGLRLLTFLGGEVTDYHAPLLRTEVSAGWTTAEVQRLWLQAMSRLPGADAVYFRRMPERLADGNFNPLAMIAGAAPTETSHAALLPDTYEDFRKTRSTAFFTDTRRRMRRLHAAGEVRIALQAAPAERIPVMTALAEQKSARWRETGAVDAFALPGYLDFYRRLDRDGLQGAEPVLSALFLDGRPIATHWGLRTARRFYWLMPAYDKAWAHFSPGRLLMEALLQDCIERRLESFDLTVGDESYKQHWADTHMPMYALLQPRSLWGAAVVAVRRIREKAKEVPALRRAVRSVRARFSGCR